MIRPAELIQRKRDGGELTPEELTELVLGYARDEVPDYQLAAFCMAVFFRGLTPAETFALTDAIVRSGDTLDLHGALGRTVVDKHSTGGVGDKTSIAVGPIVAACGVPFGKMSGRGLGHTGGTLDKLEAIPGFRVELSEQEFVDQVREVGLAIIGQTGDLVPADKRLYALRDVTATVDNVQLIAASIMSKKIAAGADAIVLDVKVGDGAFMKTLDQARALAETMRELGNRAGRRVACLLTDMDQPLGQAVGNALELHEARATLRGEGPEDFTELVLAASAQLLAFSDLGVDAAEGRARAEAAVRDGSALERFERWIRAQGGDPAEDALPRAATVRPVDCARARVRPLAPGAAGRERRARARRRPARARTTRSTTPSASSACASAATQVERGEPLAEVHARTEAEAERAGGRRARRLRARAESPREAPDRARARRLSCRD